jgi:hypothetical protein
MQQMRKHVLEDAAERGGTSKRASKIDREKVLGTASFCLFLPIPWVKCAPHHNFNRSGYIHIARLTPGIGGNNGPAQPVLRTAEIGA